MLTSSEHGLVTEFDNNASGSGTLDLQASGLLKLRSPDLMPSAFPGLTGGTGSFASVGAFTLDQNGFITTGLEDFNDDGLIPYANQTLSGQVVLGPSSTPSTQLVSQSFGLTYDVYAIDATHLKFIEMDEAPILSGDAFSQPSAAISGTMSFTLAGVIEGNPSIAGGVMVTDGAGNITASSTEDVNEAGTLGAALPFSATYASAGTGRFTLNNFAGFVGVGGGGSYAAYPSSGGLLLLEIDGSGLMAWRGLPADGFAAAPAFASPEGYGMNLTGINLGFGAEVDDIAEFSTASAGTFTGISTRTRPRAAQVGNLALTSGTFGAIDTTGRYRDLCRHSSGNNTSLNGGFALTFGTRMAPPTRSWNPTKGRLRLV